MVELVARPRERAERCPTLLSLLGFLTWPGMDLGGYHAPLREARGPLVARKLAGGVVKCAAFFALLALGAHLGFPESSFWGDHVFKLLEVYAFGSGVSDLLVAAFALQGYRVQDVFRWPIAATSVMDFWIRYNRHVNGWLKRNVFDHFGRRRVVLGVVATFAASSVIHELVFLPVAPSLVGYQTAFFMGHGAVALGGAWVGRTWRKRTGRSVPLALCHVLTVAFVVSSSVIFMRSVDAIAQTHRDWGQALLDRARR